MEIITHKSWLKYHILSMRCREITFFLKSYVENKIMIALNSVGFVYSIVYVYLYFMLVEFDMIFEENT